MSIARIFPIAMAAQIRHQRATDEATGARNCNDLVLHARLLNLLFFSSAYTMDPA
jgi:hypothetical protein